MPEASYGLRKLAQDAIGSANKRRQISRYLKKRGFEYLGKGGWLGFKNREIVSGFVIEGSSLDTYISTFVLPAFDRHSFITWALGERAVHCSSNRSTVEECDEAIGYYSATLAHIKLPKNLMDHLDHAEVKGYYPIWVRYLCYLRVGDPAAAVGYLDEAKRAMLHRTTQAKLAEIEPFAATGDQKKINQVLDGWTTDSAKIFGPAARAVDFCGSK